MSAPTAGSSKKGNTLGEANEALYDPYFGAPVSEYFASLPWPEWSDVQLNAEVWEEGRSKNTTESARQRSATTTSLGFVDEHMLKMPPLLKDFVRSWRRPHEVFPDCALTVYDPSNVNFELRVPSPVGGCDLFNHFNQLLPILQNYALYCGFPVECVSSSFVPNTQGEPWRPWHHVYGSCKAGKDQTHKPVYTPYGKYIVRLFYFGSWRRFLIDDTIPCDHNGICMLPVTQVKGELWPILLMKAVLKITSLTPGNDFSVIDLSFLSLFTGWMRWSMTTLNKTREELWRRLLAFGPRYERHREEGDVTTSPPSLKDTSKKGSSKVEDKKGPEKKGESGNVCFFVATLEGFSGEENLSKSYKVGVSMIRDIPLVKSNLKEPTKKWKRIRWVYWAEEKGLWTDERKLPPYRRLQTISVGSEINKFLTPDPKDEAVLFDIPEGENPLIEEDSDTRQTLQWSDFFKFHEYLFGLDVFFRPSDFPATFRVTSLKEAPPRVASLGSSSAKTAFRASPPQNLYYVSPVLQSTCNEPPLLFFEAPTGICLGISLWVHPRATKPFDGYLKVDEPELFKVCQGRLLVERFDWRTVSQGEIIGGVKTVGNCAVALTFRPGRHILKLWLFTDCPYTIEVYSNVEVTVHKGYKVRCLMTTESVRITNYITNVSNAFLNLLVKFGKADLPSALKAFYKAILPGNDLMIDYHRKMDGFIETFLKCLLLTLKEIIPSADELRIMLWALRSLFINPNIECELPKEVSASSIFGSGSKKTVKKPVIAFKEQSLSEIINFPWSPEEIQQIITIQKIFRGFRVRLLWKSQTPARKESKVYADRLKKIYDAVFIPQKREFEVGKLIRKIVMDNPKFYSSFKFYEDFPNVTQVEEFTGKVVNVEPFAWIPIARFIVACHWDEPVACAFYFSCNLEQFVIHVTDNDTGVEVFRVANSTSPNYYRNNNLGYTVFIYGWNEASPKTVNWRLEMVRMKHFQVIHLCNKMLNHTCHPYTIPNLEVIELKNFYVPNKKSRVCRCLIRIQKRTLLSLRLTASYSNVSFLLRILLDKRFCLTDQEFDVPDKVVMEAYSTDGAVLLPSVILEYVESNQWKEEAGQGDMEPTLYILEAFVLNDSWPLTKREWGVVEPIRVNGEFWKDSVTSLTSKRGSESRKKFTRASKKSLGEQKLIENPCWLLQVLNDVDTSGESFVVEEDKSSAESVKAMKISWEEKNPGRRLKGRDLRMQFLCRIYQEWKSQMEGVEGMFGEVEKDNDKEEEDCSDMKTVLERMSSFSYLTSDISSIRLSKSPRVLLPMPIEDLLNKYSKKRNARVSYGNEISVPVEPVSGSHTSERNTIDEAEKQRKGYLITSVKHRFMLINYLAEEQKLSSKLMGEAYERRSKAIERMAR